MCLKSKSCSGNDGNQSKGISRLVNQAERFDKLQVCVHTEGASSSKMVAMTSDWPIDGTYEYSFGESSRQAPTNYTKLMLLLLLSASSLSAANAVKEDGEPWLQSSALPSNNAESRVQRRTFREININVLNNLQFSDFERVWRGLSTSSSRVESRRLLTSPHIQTRPVLRCNTATRLCVSA